MAKIAFSDVGLRSLPAPARGQRAYWDAKLPSFGVRVSQGGTKTFVLKRHNNLITIGRFPILSLAKAREQANILLAEFTLGRLRPQSISFPAALGVFLEEKRQARRPRTVADYEYLLKRLPFQGQLADITHRDFERALNRYKGKSSRDHAIVAAKIFFGWAVKRRYITENPTSGYSKPKSTPRSRVLSDEELKSIWQVCEQRTTLDDETCSDFASAMVPNLLAVPKQFAIIVKLLILTGVRRGEAAALQGSWIHDDTLVLPASVTKNGRDHYVPLTKLAISLFPPVGTNGGLLFPARGKSSPFNGWSKAKVALDQLSGVTGWTLHDLRRTFRTNLAKLKVPPHIAERLLNHVSARNPIEWVYDQHTYLPEMRQAIEQYENYLRPILGLK